VRVDVAVLDLDDTVFLERDYVRSGFDAVGDFLTEVAGVTGFAAAAWSEFQAGARGDVFDRALRRLGVEEAPPITAMVERYRTHHPRIAPLTDVIALLSGLRLADVTVGVITDGPPASQRGKLAALDLDVDPGLVVVTGELGAGAGKPSTVAFELIEERTGRRGGALVYIGDNPHKDFVAPRRLGWRTVRVRRPGGLHFGASSGRDVDLEVPDLVDVLPVLLADPRPVQPRPDGTDVLA